MSTGKTAREEPIPAEHLAEAGVWIARLHGDDRDAALEAGFRQWLEAHPLNARAFELTTEVWEESQNLRRVVPFAHDVPQARRRWFQAPLRAVAVAGLGAAAATVAIVFGVLQLLSAEVATGIGEQRLIALEDGSRIFLNTATRIVVRYDENARRLELKSGEALFDVAKHPAWPFVVQVGDRRVTALGTSFTVRYDERHTAVTLVEGKVAVTTISGGAEAVNPGEVVSTQAGETFTLTAGQRLTLAADLPAQVDMPSLDDAIAWRRGQVVLDDTPLATAVSEMNRYNEVRLTIEQSEAATLLVNGLFQAGDSMSFAIAVAQTYGLRVVERGNEIVLTGLPQPAAQPRR